MFRLKRGLLIVSVLSVAGCPGLLTSADDGGVGAVDAAVEPGHLPSPPTQSGVVYVGHFEDTALHAYRVDGELPRAALTMELGKVLYDLALDPVADLLAAVSDQDSTVELLRLHRPGDPGAALEAPTRASIIHFEDVPLFAQMDPYHHRLYVVASPDPVGPVDAYHLHAFTTEDPTSPAPLLTPPCDIPITANAALDAVRRVLFISAAAAHTLHAIDLADDGCVSLDGEPIDLEALYPQENAFAFQVRNLTADPFRARLYAARPQWDLSELIAFDYPAVVPGDQQRYRDLASLEDLVPLVGPFDVDAPASSRATLYDAFTPRVDARTGDLFLLAGARQGQDVRALFAAVRSDLTLAPGCADLGDFGCWLRSHSGGSAGSHLSTDGAACVDWTHRVVVGTSVDFLAPELPGRLPLFRYDEALAMAPWLPEDGGDLRTGAYPVVAVCH